MKNMTQPQTPPPAKAIQAHTHDEKIKVMIIHPLNRIKEKMGILPEQALTLNDEQIRLAHEVSQDMAQFQPEEMEHILGDLIVLWSVLQKMETKTKNQNSQCSEFLISLNKLEGLALQFTSTLVADFALSLKDFMEQARLDHKAHKVIIQAHLDVIILAHRHKIKETEKAEAAKLKSMLQLAIRKNR